MKSFILYASIITLFCSCDPGYGISLVNNTDKEHTIVYIESPETAIKKADSLFTTDTTSARELKQIKWIKAQTDTAAKTYTLLIEPYRKVNLKGALGRVQLKNLDQKIVIDHLDTIVLNKDKRVSLSKVSNFMSTEVIVKVQ